MKKAIQLVGLTIGFLLAVQTAWGQLVANFSATPTSGCAPLVVGFTSTSLGTISSYYWDFGNGSTLTTPNSSVSTTYTTSGVYDVKLVVTGPSGSDTEMKVAYVTAYGSPIVQFFGSPLAGCRPLTTNFTTSVVLNAPGNGSNLWDFGDGTANDTAAAPSHTYNTAGSYGVNLTVRNAVGCSTIVNSPNNYITVHAPPVSSFSINQPYFCSVPANASFTNNSTGSGPLTTSWSFGDGGTGSGTTSLHTYTTGGTFTVSMTTTDVHQCSTTVSSPAAVVYATPVTFTTPTSVCLQDTAFFANTTASGINTVWDFGDGNTDTVNNPGHLYYAPGTYNVKLTQTIGPCTKTLTKPVTVHPLPQTTISYTPRYPCPPPIPVHFTAASNMSGVSFDWDFYDGGTGLGTPVTHTYTTVGYQAATVKTTNNSTGCFSLATIDTIEIHALRGTITTAPLAGCVPLTATLYVALFGTVLVPPPPPIVAADPTYPAPATSWNYYSISGGSISSSTLEHPAVTWSTVGKDTIRANGWTANGCQYEAMGVVIRDTPIVANFSVDSTVCPDVPVLFTNLSQYAPGVGIHWVPGDGSDQTDTSWSPNWVHVYKKPGTYTILFATNHNWCMDTVYKQITVNPSNANFGFVRGCPPHYTTQFVDSSDQATSWSWDFGDGNYSTLQNPSHSYNAPGTYNVILRTFNNIYGCGDTIVREVSLQPSTLSFRTSEDDDTLCPGRSAILIGTFTGSTNAIYQWSADGGPFSPATYDSIYIEIFNQPGYHDITMVTVSGDSLSCHDTLTKTNFFLVTHPTARLISSDTIGCAPLLVNFADSSTASFGSHMAYRWWQFNDNIPILSSSASASRMYNSGVSDTIKLIVADNIGCKDSMTQIVTIRNPIVRFEMPKPDLCIGDSLHFTDSTTGLAPLSYYWSFGDGDTSSIHSPTHAWDSAGVYPVRLIVRDPTPCTDTMTAIINVHAPVAGFSMSKNSSVCPPLIVNFTNTSSGATSYSWDMGTGSTPITVFNPVFTYGAPGKYDIVLTATDSFGCSDTAMAQAYVLGYPGAFSYTPLRGCTPQEVQFNAVVSAIPQITWDFEDGNVITSPGSSIKHTYTQPGRYIPKVIFSDGLNCSASSVGTDTIWIDEVHADFHTSVPCMGVPFTLSDSSGAVFDSPNDWRWFFGGSDSANGKTASYTFAGSGPHPVTLIASNSWGCVDTITKDVFINSLPIVDAGPADTGICPGDQAMVIAHGAQTYTWTPASLVTCATCDTTFLTQAAPPTMYYVYGTDTNGCINKDSILAHIQIKTTSSVQPGGEICPGETFRLHVSGATVYSWQPVAFLDSPNIASPLAKPITTTKYVVMAQEGTCLVRYDTVTVVVHPNPVFDAGYDEWITYGSAVMLQPTRDGIARIEWKPDSTLSCWDCFDPVAHPSYTTLYRATAYNEWGCSSSDSVWVHVRCNGDSVFIPNTFTPNGDGRNDVFFPRGKGISGMSSMRVFNRWGELVFERTHFPLNDEGMGWDGTYNGKALPPDVYMYSMTSRCDSGEPVSFKGDITLIR